MTALKTALGKCRPSSEEKIVFIHWRLLNNVHVWGVFSVSKKASNWTITKGVNSNSPDFNLALGVGRENSCKVMQKLFFILRAVPNPPKTSFFHQRTVPPFLFTPLYTT